MTIIKIICIGRYGSPEQSFIICVLSFLNNRKKFFTQRRNINLFPILERVVFFHITGCRNKRFYIILTCVIPHRRIPYKGLNYSVKAGKNAATTVMPLLSTALYLGQFLSPLVVSPLASATHLTPYMVGVTISFVYLLQAILTRKEQMLP